MKRAIYLLFTVMVLGACGGKKGNESAQLSVEQESQVADSITTVLQSQQQEISTTTEETLAEVDSLLENL